MIRPAKHSDVPRLIELGTLLHSTTSYSTMNFCPVKSAAFLHELINGQGVVFVAEVRGEVVGGMAGGVIDQWFSNDLIAYDYSLFVEPSKRNGVIAVRLIQTFKEWARLKGAKQIYMGIGTGVSVEGTTRLYESQGLRNIGPLLMMEI
ncbi:GNAT family N-acetyltransferase [Pseudomonas sp. W2Jun17]|uniref:GNAT family N-acetyltransferase n=1 Tax=Pseudomonas sp. W2Jun17 TaxID=1553460 RepID=UPI0020045C37|nr:GNAT family N-acetyltransferase [Pseudomonas sp. W2Jun17]MCK3849941.1 GNAT family N-acetyltransferase [Pseudomonas sp. W2Jun17]